MKKLVRWFAPNSREFFIMLDAQAENALQAAKQLKEFIDNYDKINRNERKSVAQSIKLIESKGDELASSITENIDSKFKTPFDRQDVKDLTMILDDITDLASRAASRFFILSIERINEHTAELAGIMLKLVSEVKELVSDLRNMKGAREHYLNIYKLEREADELFNEALSELFHFYKNPIDVMKYREIYELLEGIADKCKDIANAVEGIAIRHG